MGCEGKQLDIFTESQVYTQPFYFNFADSYICPFEYLISLKRKIFAFNMAYCFWICKFMYIMRFQKQAAKYMEALVEHAKQCDELYAGNVLYSIRVIGSDYPDLLAKYKGYFEGTCIYKMLEIEDFSLNLNIYIYIYMTLC